MVEVAPIRIQDAEKRNFRPIQLVTSPTTVWLRINEPPFLGIDTQTCSPKLAIAGIVASCCS